MAKDKEEIKKEIEDFKLQHGGDYSDYYIGITNDIDRRMYEDSEVFIEHLNKGEYTKGNPNYSEECKTNAEAVEIERYFQHGDKGMLKYNPHSVGIETSTYIYCYKMTENNKKAVLNESSSAAKEIRHNINVMTSLSDFAKNELN